MCAGGGVDCLVENLSLFAFDILSGSMMSPCDCWESFIIRLWYTLKKIGAKHIELRIFHYSPLIYLYSDSWAWEGVENLSLFAFDILLGSRIRFIEELRIFHYSPLIYFGAGWQADTKVENLSLFAFDILFVHFSCISCSWESFIIRLWYTFNRIPEELRRLRIFHYSPLIYFGAQRPGDKWVENLSLFAFDILALASSSFFISWESFIIRLWYTSFHEDTA